MGIVSLNDTLDHLDMINIHRILHPKSSERIFLTSVYEKVPRIDHIVGHKK